MSAHRRFLRLLALLTIVSCTYEDRGYERLDGQEFQMEMIRCVTHGMDSAAVETLLGSPLR